MLMKKVSEMMEMYIKLLQLLQQVHSAKKVLDSSQSQFVPEMLHIRQIKSISLEAGRCPLCFNTKRVESVDKN